LDETSPATAVREKKYKKCHLDKDEIENRKAREKAALNVAKVAAANAEKEPEKKEGAHAKHDEKGGFFTKVAGKMGFARGQQRRAPPQAQKKGGS